MSVFSKLDLGWHVTDSLDPRYWVQHPDAKPGSQSEDELVSVRAEDMETHTAIIAQSGSGKSFFLGRLVEEIILKTKARCVIFDPNADFRKIYDAQGNELWQRDNYYIRLDGKGKLPTEAARKDFLDRWPHDFVQVIMGQKEEDPHCHQFCAHWPSIDIDFIADELDGDKQVELRHCHSFVGVVEFLLSGVSAEKQAVNLLATAQSLFEMCQQEENKSLLRMAMEKVFLGAEFKLSNRNALLKFSEVVGKITISIAGLKVDFAAMEKQKEEWERAQRFDQFIKYGAEDPIAFILGIDRYVSLDIGRFYFSRAYEYQQKGLVQMNIAPSAASNANEFRIRVLDLPSFVRKQDRLLATYAVLTEEWTNAREAWAKALLILNPEDDKRVPTFIVLDEAHNLIPIHPRSRAESSIKEMFLSIIAEGRKYGLFLILVTQRPDKVDPLALGECDNQGLMKLSSESILSKAGDILGLDNVPPRLLQKCLEFKKSRVLLTGKWAAPSAQLLYCAARRTVEGGRSLRSEYWASPEEPGHDIVGSQEILS